MGVTKNCGENTFVGVTYFCGENMTFVGVTDFCGENRLLWREHDFCGRNIRLCEGEHGKLYSMFKLTTVKFVPE